MTNDSSSEWQGTQKRAKNFQCPCGKSYLSYPALYTHIKQAHGGKAPGQIKRPDTHNRGRPKATGNAKIQQHNKSIQQILKHDPIPQLLSFLQSSYSSSINKSIRQIYQIQPVYRLIMNDKDKLFAPIYLKQDRIYDVKIGQGIVQFFKEIDEKIENKAIYDEIVMLIVLLTEHIIEETEDQNVLGLGTIGLMPEFVNYFIIHDFKKPVERLKLQNLWIFKDENAIQVLNYFFKWMLYKRFTLTKVDINQKYLNPDQSQSDQAVGSQSGGENYNPQDEEQNGEQEKNNLSNNSESQSLNEDDQQNHHEDDNQLREKQKQDEFPPNDSDFKNYPAM